MRGPWADGCSFPILFSPDSEQYVLDLLLFRMQSLSNFILLNEFKVIQDNANIQLPDLNRRIGKKYSPAKPGLLQQGFAAPRQPARKSILTATTSSRIRRFLSSLSSSIFVLQPFSGSPLQLLCPPGALHPRIHMSDSLTSRSSVLGTHPGCLCNTKTCTFSQTTHPCFPPPWFDILFCLFNFSPYTSSIYFYTSCIFS